MDSNYLTNINFRFTIKRLPAVSFKVQRATIPGITLNPANFPTPLKTIQVYGDHMDIEPLQVEFLVDEDLKNWNEIYDWLIKLAGPRNKTEAMGRYDDPYSDGSLLILSSAMNPLIEFHFTDLHPTSLGALQLDATSNSQEPVQATVSFAFTSLYYSLLR